MIRAVLDIVDSQILSFSYGTGTGRDAPSLKLSSTATTGPLLLSDLSLVVQRHLCRY